MSSPLRALALLDHPPPKPAPKTSPIKSPISNPPNPPPPENHEKSNHP